MKLGYIIEVSTDRGGYAIVKIASPDPLVIEKARIGMSVNID